MHENTSAGAAGFDLSPAEKTRMGMPVMAPTAAPSVTPWVPASEVERLRALLLEGAAHLDQVRTTEAGIKWVETVQREFAPAKPAPLPYRVGGSSGRAILDANGRVLATVAGAAWPSDTSGEAEATAEFIARACSSFPELVRVAREGLRYARYGSALHEYSTGRGALPPPVLPYAQDLAAAVIEAATGERP